MGVFNNAEADANSSERRLRPFLAVDIVMPSNALFGRSVVYLADGTGSSGVGRDIHDGFRDFSLRPFPEQADAAICLGQRKPPGQMHGDQPRSIAGGFIFSFMQAA